MEEIEKAANALSKAENASLIKEFEATLPGEFHEKQFRKESWGCHMVFQQAVSFWQQKALPLPSPSDFAAQNNLPDPVQLNSEIKEIEDRYIAS